jgi:O-antigen ligase
LATAAHTPQRGGIPFSWREALIAVVAGLGAFALVTAGVIDLRHVVMLVVAIPLLVVIANKPEWGLVALFGAATLDVQGRLVQIAGVQFTIYQALAGFLFIMFVMRYRRGRIDLRRTPLDVPLLVFMALAATSIAVAPSMLSSAVDWISLASSIFLMYAVIVFADTEDKLTTVVWAAVAIATFLAVFALLERFGIYSISGSFVVDYGSGIRPTTTFKDTNMYGTLTYVSLAFCVPLLLQTKDWRLRFLGLVAVPLNLAALWSTHSRGSWIAAIVVALVILVLVRVTWRVRLAAIVAFALVGVGVVALESQFIADRIVNLAGEGSAMSRYYMGQAGIDMAVDYPFGVGLGGFPEVYPLYRVGPVRASLVESHMAYLTLLVETGILGLLAYLWILWRFAKNLVPASLKLPPGRDQALLVGSIAAVAGVATQALTYSLEGHKLLWFALGVGMAVYVRRVIKGQSAKGYADARPAESDAEAQPAQAG